MVYPVHQTSSTQTYHFLLKGEMTELIHCPNLGEWTTFKQTAQKSWELDAIRIGQTWRLATPDGITALKSGQHTPDQLKAFNEALTTLTGNQTWAIKGATCQRAVATLNRELVDRYMDTDGLPPGRLSQVDLTATWDICPKGTGGFTIFHTMYWQRNYADAHGTPTRGHILRTTQVMETDSPDIHVEVEDVTGELTRFHQVGVLSNGRTFAEYPHA